MTDKERVLKVLKFSEMNKNKFAKAIGVAQSTLAVAINPNKSVKPGMAIIKGIMDLYPTINPIWLIKGEGDMWMKEIAEDNYEELYEQQKKINKMLAMLIKEKNEDVYNEIKDLL